MAMTDPIANYLTSIRNALKARHTKVSIPTSKIKVEISKVLKQEGFIKDFNVTAVEGKRDHLNIELRYNQAGTSVIRGIKRVSKPGCRIYRDCTSIPILRSGMGTFILSTPKGLMVDRNARRQKVGGELICSIW